MKTRLNPDEELVYLVGLSDVQLKEMGLTEQQIIRLKSNKFRREEQALAIIKQSGVPKERWPRFRDDVYYVHKDFTGELEPFAKQAFTKGEILKGTGNYSQSNKDGTRTEYPFSIGTYLPNSNVSPIQRVIEVLTADDGTLLMTTENQEALEDMVNYVLSSQNYNKHIFNIQSFRSNFKGDSYHSYSDLQSNPNLAKEFNDLAENQAQTLVNYLLKLNPKLTSKDIVRHIEGANKPRTKNSSGVALSREGGKDSTYNKYNNVIVVSLTTLPTNKNDLVDYDYYSGDKQESNAEVDLNLDDNYKKFYKNTQATTVMPISGVNIQVVFEFPSNDTHKSVYLYMPDMITVSHSVHRTKVPVTVLGDTTITGIGLGTKMVAGSIVKVFTRRDPFHNYIRLFVDERSSNMSKARKASLVNIQNSLPINEVSDHMRDDIGPFNIHLIMMSEYDCVYKDPPKVDSILGCTIINTGKVYSVENLITEETLSFMAKTVVYDDDMSATVAKTVSTEPVLTGSSLLEQLRG